MTTRSGVLFSKPSESVRTGEWQTVIGWAIARDHLGTTLRRTQLLFLLSV